MSILKSASALLTLTLCEAALAQSGFIDPSFGGGDVLHGPWGTNGGAGVLTWVGYQSTGKIVVVGKPSIPSPAGQALVYNGAIRYNVDGTLDTAFGQGGNAWTLSAPYLPNNQFGPIQGAIQADDQVLILSSGTQIARYTAAGAADTTFGSHGVSANLGLGHAGSFALQPDGKIVLACAAGGAIARLNTNGSLDTTFGSFGHGSTPGHIVDPGVGAVNPRCMAVQPDGGIVLASASGLARYLPTGALDTTFGAGGHAGMPALSGAPHGLALAADWRIVIAGSAFNCGTTALAARFTAAGAPDATFGDGTQGVGVAYRTFATQWSDVTYGGLALQADGSVVVSLMLVTGSSGQDMAVWRLTPWGLPDPAFGPTRDGVSQRIGQPAAPDGSRSIARSIAVDPFGRIIMACNSPTGPEIVAIQGQ